MQPIDTKYEFSITSELLNMTSTQFRMVDHDQTHDYGHCPT
jgi:hypothetical protein